MESFDYKKYTWIAGGVALIGIAFVSLATGISSLKLVNYPNGTVPTITVLGEGEVTALPDIATVTFTVRESAKTVPEAQKIAETKMSAVLAAVSALSVDKKDTKTLSYTVNPKYETAQIYCITIPCPQGRTVVVGYEVAEVIQIKVRKIDQAGAVVGALGGVNVTEISGPEFTVDNMDAAEAEAKAKAIAQAKVKAEATAKALGAHLGEVTQFSDNGNYSTYARMDMVSSKSPMSVSLPQGESVIKSSVTVTYSLK
ncbi:MAG: SIMPL domain-containing protein [Candidatus Paceibacterota bacterium]